MKSIFINIKELIQVRNSQEAPIKGKDMSILPTLKNAFLIVDDGRISGFGEMSSCPDLSGFEVIDAEGKMLLPAWVDSHTHIVYSGSRESEFVDRIKGLSYQEIANKGGGILNSALKLNETSEEELFEQSAHRLEEVMKLGTGAIEIKSGYGLSFEGEMKMLRVIKKLKESYPAVIKSTFLGAHAIPNKYKTDRESYMDLLISELLPAIKDQKLADFIDVFCEEGYFTVEELIRIIKAGQEYGLKAKVHVNQFSSLGGIKAACDHEALSVDHLEVLTDDDLEVLKNSETISVGLPNCSYFLGIPYTPARKIIDSGLALALATDFNPGSSPSGNMNQVVSAACIKMNMTPEESINAATINAAYGMDVHDQVGSIQKGLRANLILTTEMSTLDYLPYAFGSNMIDSVFINGEKI